MDSQGLPPGWSVGYDSVTGFPYFIDHINKSTTWEDPRKSKNQVHPITSSSTSSNTNNHHHQFEREQQSSPNCSDKKYHENTSTTNETQPSSSSSIPIKSEHAECHDSNETAQLLDPMSLIEHAQSELEELKAKIIDYFPTCKDKAYLLFEDKLEKLTLRLDNIDSAGDSAIRNKRREVILSIQSVLNSLEDKLTNQLIVVKWESDSHNLSSVDNNTEPQDSEQQQQLDCETVTHQTFNKDNQHE
ncbi:unnamed protein product [Heterobilharzia americana]|nr:unnamed protein product [Heterobilharzia americana]